ncbi:MAG TPA: hypothetical protein VN577_19260 [Terriglobales bacterium]|nr:hypothetical protein [Terriglobales bacterium]
MTLKNRCVAGLITGVVLHFFIFHPYLPYSVRESRVPGFWTLVVVFAVAGFLLNLGNTERRGLICACVVGAMFAGNMVIIAMDWMKDPTTHNLFPFEFIMIALAFAPLGAGTVASLYASRLRA